MDITKTNDTIKSIYLFSLSNLKSYIIFLQYHEMNLKCIWKKLGAQIHDLFIKEIRKHQIFYLELISDTSFIIYLVLFTRLSTSCFSFCFHLYTKVFNIEEASYKLLFSNYSSFDDLIRFCPHFKMYDYYNYEKLTKYTS